MNTKNIIIGVLAVLVLTFGFFSLRKNNEQEVATFTETYTVVYGNASDRLSVDGVITSKEATKYFVGDYQEESSNAQVPGLDGLDGFDLGGFDVSSILGGQTTSEPASSTSKISDDIQFLVEVGQEVNIGDQLWSYEVFDSEKRVREYAEIAGYVSAVAQNGTVTINGFGGVEIDATFSDAYLDDVSKTTPVIIRYSSKQYIGYIDSMAVFATGGTRAVTIKFNSTPTNVVQGANVDVYFIDKSITDVVSVENITVSDDGTTVTYDNGGSPATLDLDISGTGSIQSTQIIEHFYEDGILDEVVVEVGDVVTKGQSVAFYTVNENNEKYSEFKTEYVLSENKGIVTLVDDINGIVEIQNLSDLIIDFNVKQRLGHSISEGQEVIVEYNNKKYEGFVSYRAPILNVDIDPNNPHYVFEAEIYEEDNFLMVNGEVKVSILVEEFEEVLLIPVESVYTVAEGSAVYYYVDRVVDNELIPTKIEIESGSFQGKYMVLSGLAENDVIKIK
jgi:biotin carboxyl carrier protein